MYFACIGSSLGGASQRRRRAGRATGFLGLSSGLGSLPSGTAVAASPAGPVSRSVHGSLASSPAPEKPPVPVRATRTASRARGSRHAAGDGDSTGRPAPKDRGLSLRPGHLVHGHLWTGEVRHGDQRRQRLHLGPDGDDQRQRFGWHWRDCRRRARHGRAGRYGDRHHHHESRQWLLRRGEHHAQRGRRIRSGGFARRQPLEPADVPVVGQ